MNSNKKFMSGLHCNISMNYWISIVLESYWVVYKACITEHQLQQDVKSNKGTSFSTKGIVGIS